LFVLGYALRPPRAAGTLSMRRCPGHDTFLVGLVRFAAQAHKGRGRLFLVGRCAPRNDRTLPHRHVTGPIRT
jgi:hypothetical protein